jgi:outer membrane receptor for ferric coprogen and ferric-rhodotorulic acid
MNALLALLAAAAAPDAAGSAVEPRGADEIIVTGERTDRTQDYAVKQQTTTMRFPLSQRETPQSVSVVTRAQIEDFKLNDINDVLKTVPGVQVQAQETDRIYYSARGFDIQTFQIDGIGLPFAFTVQTGTIDTAIYDHIDVVRGAPGLLSSTGNPAAVVNFIRKRPTRDFQAHADAQYGSYNDVRIDGDVSVPITKDGGIRARVVGALTDKDSYLDRYHLRRWIGYGIVEADLGPDTTLTGGYGHQDHKSTGAQWGSVPVVYSDGSRIALPRSANTGPDWAGWNVIDRQIFGDLVHHFNDDWFVKVTAVRRAISEDDKLFYVIGSPDRTTGLGASAFTGAYKGETRNLTLDAYVTGKVSLFGRQHDVMFGVNRAAQDYTQGSSAGTFNALTLAQIYDGSYARPNFSSTYLYTGFSGLNTHTRRETAYGLVRFNLADPLKIMVGGNYTHATSEGNSYGVASVYDREKFLPFVGATYDLTGTISAYASYATIFRPQTETSVSRQLIAPVTGDNIEGGFKGEWFEGRLNASIAIFQARQRHTAESAGFDTTIGQTVYRGVNATSQGIEFEFGGRIAPGLQATGGYTLMRVRGDDDQPVRTFVPRNLGRLNLTYSPPSFDKLKVGIAAQYQSKIYNDPVGLLTTAGQQIRISQSGYALIDLLAKYSLTRNLDVSLNLKNVTNRKYLNAINFDQAYYGAPRTVLGTVTLKY